MRIGVAIKQVPTRDSELRIDASGRWIDEANLAFEINEPDAYALEEALQLKGKHGGEVATVAAGPGRVVQALRETLAKGADRAIHVECSALFTFDPLAVASLLAAAIAPEHFDLVLTGIQSDDLGQGQTGVMLAELLGLPHATLVVEVEKLDGFLRVERELEEGWRQSVELPLPALLTVQSGIRRLRYATLLGIKKARGKQIPTLRAADLAELPGPPRAPSAPMERIYFPPRTQRAQLFEGDARRMAAALVEKLRFEARVL